MRALLFAATLLLASPALASGSTAFEHEGVSEPGAWVASTEQRYRVQAYVGEVIRTTLTWDDALGRLDVVYSASPGLPGCPVNDVLCIAEQLPAGLMKNTVDCNHRPDGALDGSPIVDERIAHASGLYTLNVHPALAAVPVPYEIRVEVGEGGAERTEFLGRRGLSVGAPFLCTVLEETVWGPVRRLG